MLSARIGRVRLVDAVVIAGGALLILKMIGMVAGPSDRDTGPDGLPKFGRVIAHARTNYVPPDPTTTGSVPDKPKEAAPSTPKAPAAEAPAPAGGSPSERAIRERLGERREELQQRARELETREKLLEDNERKLDAKTSDADAAETARAGAPSKEAEAEAAALKGLVVMYETMKPKDAARVFDRLPQDVLVPVVRQIAPRKMAEILAAMAPEKAERLTVALARRPSGEGKPAAATLPAGELPAIDLPPRPAAGGARP